MSQNNSLSSYHYSWKILSFRSEVTVGAVITWCDVIDRSLTALFPQHRSHSGISKAIIQNQAARQNFDNQKRKLRIWNSLIIINASIQLAHAIDKINCAHRYYLFILIIVDDFRWHFVLNVECTVWITLKTRRSS